MKRSILFLCAVIGLLGCVTAQTKSEVFTITITSPEFSAGPAEETIAIKWSDIIAKHPNLKPGNFKVVNIQTGAEIPFQLEYKGSLEIQNLLVQTSFNAKKTFLIKIVSGKPKYFPAKVYGRYVPERMDDFAWENDKIAFRAYGKALEATKENAYGLDVWAKRTDSMVINKWYKRGDYHADHGQGLDYYSVGFTLGAGDIAPYINNTIVFPKNYRSWKILDKGPIRFTFQLNYDEWDVAGNKTTVNKVISLDAGSQLNKVEATFSFAGSKSLPVVVGIVKRNEPGHLVLDEKGGIMSYWEPQHDADGTLGLGVIMIDQLSKMLVTDTHLLSIINAKNKQPVVYYTGAVWSKAGYFNNKSKENRWSNDNLTNYLNLFKSNLSRSINIQVQQ